MSARMREIVMRSVSEQVKGGSRRVQRPHVNNNQDKARNKRPRRVRARRVGRAPGENRVASLPKTEAIVIFWIETRLKDCLGIKGGIGSRRSRGRRKEGESRKRFRVDCVDGNVPRGPCSVPVCAVCLFGSLIASENHQIPRPSISTSSYNHNLFCSFSLIHLHLHHRHRLLNNTLTFSASDY